MTTQAPSGSPRFPDIPLQAMSPLQRQVNDEICSGPRGALIGPFRVLMHAPKLEQRLHKVGEYIRYECSLPKDIIELAVLVTSQRWKCHFEWAIHSKLGLDTGLSPTTLAELHAGRRPADLTAAQAAAWQLATEAHRDGHASDATFDTAVQAFGREGVLELLALCGYYSTLAMILNTSRFMPDGGKVWPEAP